MAPRSEFSSITLDAPKIQGTARGRNREPPLAQRSGFCKRPPRRAGSRRWRSAPVFASARRGAPQKSAKRKRFYWVPCTLAALYEVQPAARLQPLWKAPGLRPGTMQSYRWPIFCLILPGVKPKIKNKPSLHFGAGVLCLKKFWVWSPMGASPQGWGFHYWAAGGIR